MLSWINTAVRTASGRARKATSLDVPARDSRKAKRLERETARDELRRHLMRKISL